ncbi:preprotein translocase subunit YajC [Kitasatospora sp. NBC_01287]|uniref:preprotein translocase subunit YajC n=1 Tax=Kitasatospora sp. NBC_01287 TaxID=2903573 RepID=UPI0022579A26|nr:preprotein translocase subunit YajC [Kitasatospora sp. NBC_01287]MCX4745146.1 preprotein translocase subunit YajC [Kitasatospora sp. NBC_01287]
MSLLIFVIPVALVFLMFRSQKKRQQQASQMQSTMEPGAAVRTIGGMYALVKAVNDSTVELEMAPGVVAHFSKSAVAAVIDAQEYDEIINGRPEEDEAADLDAELADTELVEDEVLKDEDAQESISLAKADSEKPAAK